MNSLYRQVKYSGMAAIALTMLAAMVLLAGTALPAQAQTETLMYQFTGSPDGANPIAGVVLKGTTLYGTTWEGGNPGSGNTGNGTVYKLTTTKGKIKETILHNFTGVNNGDGANPTGGVVFDTAGNLYGTTEVGGTFCNCGTIYKIAKDGTYSILHSFDQSDGIDPWYETLALDKLGNLYGTTLGGTYGNGNVFKLAPGGTLTPLYNFTGGSDGGTPVSGVTLDTKGNIYGVAPAGGANGLGVLYEITTTGVFSVLYNFAGGSDGALPYSPPVFKGANLYGTTETGGVNLYGTIYEFTPAKGKKAAEEKVLYSFSDGVNDGAEPWTGKLTFDKLGNIYGTTQAGGTINVGTVYKLATDGTLTVLYSFDQTPDGQTPRGNVAFDTKGNLYTTAEFGGNTAGEYGGGTVIKVTP